MMIFTADMQKGEKMNNLIDRQEVIEHWAEKCMTCKHVYKRIDDNDTLYCRCRKGCKYEQVKNRRSDKNS